MRQYREGTAANAELAVDFALACRATNGKHQAVTRPRQEILDPAKPRQSVIELGERIAAIVEIATEWRQRSRGRAILSPEEQLAAEAAAAN
jgi:hypothetical protein